MKHPNYIKSFNDILAGMVRSHPDTPIANHLYGALKEYDGEFWGISNKQLFLCLEKYSECLSLEDEVHVEMWDDIIKHEDYLLETEDEEEY